MNTHGAFIAFITVVCTLVAIWALEHMEARSQVNVCVTPEQRDHIRDVMTKAVDHALDEQVGKLFANWVLDGTGQPKRAQNGTNNAIKAFIVARAAVLSWDPAECTATFQLQSAETKSWR